MNRPGECQNCKWVERHADGELEWLLCRRFPPQRTQWDAYAGGECEVSQQPVVEPSDWCGEWEWNGVDREEDAEK